MILYVWGSSNVGAILPTIANGGPDRDCTDVLARKSGHDVPRRGGDALIQFLRGAEKAISGLDVLDDAVFRAVPDLRLVSKYGVGLDMIDLDAARRHGVEVRWTPGVNRQAVAELAICFMVALCRSV